MACKDIISPTPEPPANQSLRFRRKFNTISVLTQSPVLPFQFDREKKNSSMRSSVGNSVIDELTSSLACFGRCRAETHICPHPCAQHSVRRAFVADADELIVDETPTIYDMNTLMDGVSVGACNNQADLKEMGYGKCNERNNTEDNNESNNKSGKGTIGDDAVNTGSGNNEDSGSNYSNDNNDDANGNDGTGHSNDRGAGGNFDGSSSSSSDGSGDGPDEGQPNGAGGSDNEAPENNNSAESDDDTLTAACDSAEEDRLAAFRLYYAIGQPVPRSSTYPISDPLFQRSGEFYARDFNDPVKRRFKKDLPNPSQTQLSCLHKWSVEDCAKGCCHACGGWRGLYVFNCSICKALSRACCMPRWTEVVKARCALTAKRPDEILHPAEVEYKLAEQKRGIRNAAITEWPLVSKRGRYPHLQ